MPFGTLAAAGITALGSIASHGLNYASQMRTNAQNRRMAEEAYRREQAAIREQNIYNSPSMQVARMKAAGLSPNLAYGASGELTGQQTDIPSYSAIPAESPHVGDLGQTALDIQRFGLEWREQANRDKLAQVDVALKDASAFLAWSQGEHTQLENEYFVSSWDLRLENLESLNERNWQDLLESRSRERLNEEEIKRIRKDVDRIQADIDLTKEQQSAIIAKLPHEIRQMDSQTALNWVMSEQGKEQIKLISAETILTSDRNYREGLQMHINQQDADTRKQALQLDAAWREWQQKYQKAELVSKTCVDIAKTVVGFAGVREMSNSRIESAVQQRMDRIDRYTHGW